MSNIPFEHALWTTKEIGAYIHVSPNNVVERYASLPDFPRRIELPTTGGGRSHPRWRAKEVYNESAEDIAPSLG